MMTPMTPQSSSLDHPSDGPASIEVSFVEEHARDSFVIEELTLNPFILRDPRRRGSTRRVELWMELLIRRTDLDGRDKPAPTIHLAFAESLSDESAPRCRLDNNLYPDSFYPDLNFLMHADIWYSFVRLGEDDREFMSKGYNQPIRVLSVCRACEAEQAHSVHVNREHWVGGSHEYLQDLPFANEARLLLDKIRLFNQRALHPPNISDFFERVSLPYPDGFPSRELLVPKNEEFFAPVYFENSPTCRARFAVRRLPWKQKAGTLNPPYEVSYGGTAKVTGSGREFSVHPLLFSQDSPTYSEPLLGPGEGMRFWLKWQSMRALDLDRARERFSFAHILNARVRLEHFNTFFRVPSGFDSLPGGVLDLRHYPVPPRLFFVWGPHNAESCFSFSADLGVTPPMTELDMFTDFYDKGNERRRLSDIFVLGWLGNIAAGTFIATVLDSLTSHSHFDERFWVPSSLALAFVGGAGISLHRGASLHWTGLLFALALAVLAVPAFRTGYPVVITLAFAILACLIWALDIKVWNPFSFRYIMNVKWFKRRRYLKACLNKMKGTLQ